MKKILKILIIISCCLVINFGIIVPIVEASHGFADYTDEEADKETERLMKEQQEELEESAEKSRDNYLQSLEVEGYELTPKFDKQTIDYVIKGKINSDKITIKATPSDEKATVSGVGTIEIQPDVKQYEVNVTAESGTVRTYYIYLDEEEKEETVGKTKELEIQSNTNSVQEENNIMKIIKDNKIVIILVLVVIVVILISMMNKKKKKRRKGKH